MVFMYFAVSVSNIIALDCHIPMPLHMIFKSVSVVIILIKCQLGVSLRLVIE